jgi:type VI secretion system protein ImpA
MSILNIAELLAPISDSDPAGSSLTLKDENDLAEARRDDPRADEPKSADWIRVHQLAEEILTTRSKHLDVATRLTEALVKRHGFAGLRDGLQLLRRLTDECWERMQPAIDDGDLSMRVGAFEFLDDTSGLSLFPNTVRAVPLLHGKEEDGYSCLDWQRAELQQDKDRIAEMQLAGQRTPQDKLEASFKELDEADQALAELLQALQNRMGNDAPRLTNLRTALADCRRFGQPYRKIPETSRPDSEGKNDTPGEGEDGQAGLGVGRAPRTRKQAYDMLRKAAAVLEELEPHSPIPYLVRRAVELGEMRFPDLAKQLIRSPDLLTELYREFGIHPDAEEASSSGES